MSVNEALRALVEQAGAGPTDFGNDIGQRGELRVGVRAPVARVFGQLGWATPFQPQRRQRRERGILLSHGGGSSFSVPVVTDYGTKQTPTLAGKTPSRQRWLFTKIGGHMRTNERSNCPENVQLTGRPEEMLVAV